MKLEQDSSPANPRSNGNGQPSARQQADRPNFTVVTLALAAQVERLSIRIDQMERQLDYVKRAWDMLGTSHQGVCALIEQNGVDLGLQFELIAKMQAEVDRLKANEVTLQTEINLLRTKNPPVEAEI